MSSLLKLTHHTQSRYVDLLQIGSFGPPSCMCPRELTRSRGDPEERHTDSQSHLPPQRLVDGLDGLHYPHTKMLSVQHGLAKSTLDDYTNIGSASSSIKGLP